MFLRHGCPHKHLIPQTWQWPWIGHQVFNYTVPFGCKVFFNYAPKPLCHRLERHVDHFEHAQRQHHGLAFVQNSVGTQLRCCRVFKRMFHGRAMCTLCGHCDSAVGSLKALWMFHGRAMCTLWGHCDSAVGSFKALWMFHGRAMCILWGHCDSAVGSLKALWMFHGRAMCNLWGHFDSAVGSFKALWMFHGCANCASCVDTLTAL